MFVAPLYKNYSIQDHITYNESLMKINLIKVLK